VGDDEAVSPKDRFLTVYGRKPVLEALADTGLEVDKVILADTARGPGATEIQQAAKAAGVPVQRASAHRVKVLAGNGKQDQGVLADVVAPRMRSLAAALEDRRPPARVLLLDGITTPANVGMILRTATAAGLEGVVVPRRGVAALDPLVVKASAGVAFRAPVLRCGSAQSCSPKRGTACTRWARPRRQRCTTPTCPSARPSFWVLRPRASARKSANW
jgi:23S rRNA (guanosine2251-2'-O)-methyltransferase